MYLLLLCCPAVLGLFDNFAERLGSHLQSVKFSFHISTTSTYCGEKNNNNKHPPKKQNQKPHKNNKKTKTRCH